ncbi:type III-A CRISPR-associated protein Csm2 [Leucothrix pacifica]|uniref:CRISPR system Cms protein Csm2 n=1 Tax=Leucothrix pacifica TaxID=1247513 RepID=A0A317CMW5_9GAMM|nr:type III-A CRISPR-associated protein Csm2 [Leucothrix pacifica]PWQ97650.1 type III-A CRISPR-associated protein Csm2 [Leucothrix pacifica]
MSYQHKGRRQNDTPRIDTSGINFSEITKELFDSIAERCAKSVAAAKSKHNKPTQLRRFYDEVVMWENKVNTYPDKFSEYLPFIRMLNAKVAYAKGRDLVDDNYVTLLSHCLSQVNTAQDMRVFKLFIEAFMGFYKVERPSG